MALSICYFGLCLCCGTTVSGYDGAMMVNYNVTKYQLYKDEQDELTILANRYTTQQIDYNQYITEKIKIEQKYNY